jgi:hypothetical protein
MNTKCYLILYNFASVCRALLRPCWLSQKQMICKRYRLNCARCTVTHRSDVKLTEHQHGCHNNIRHQREDAERHVSGRVETSADDLQEGLGPWRTDLELNGQHGEQKELYRGAGCVPERAADAVLHNITRWLHCIA